MAVEAAVIAAITEGILMLGRLAELHARQQAGQEITDEELQAAKAAGKAAIQRFDNAAACDKEGRQ